MDEQEGMQVFLYEPEEESRQLSIVDGIRDLHEGDEMEVEFA
jgi:hypothetical protein